MTETSHVVSSDGRTVSVVIPTRNRPDVVLAAVRSALGQTAPPLEVIVVVDGPDPQTVARLEDLHESSLRIVQHESPQGAGAARNTGIFQARGSHIAFLDDDDLWRPGKLEAQIAWLDAHPGEPTVLGTQAVWNDGSESPATWPLRAPGPDEAIAHYLFVRDHAGEGALPTPTLLVDAELARSCPLPQHLSTHEEWDWMLDLDKRGARFAVVMEALVEVDARPRRRSVSRTATWRASLAWGLSRAQDMGDEAFSAFVLTEVARTAVLEKAGAIVQTAIGAVALTGRVRRRDVARFLGRPIALRRRISQSGNER